MCFHFFHLSIRRGFFITFYVYFLFSPSSSDDIRATLMIGFYFLSYFHYVIIYPQTKTPHGSIHTGTIYKTERARTTTAK